jgi:hypothetical protein
MIKIEKIIWKEIFAVKKDHNVLPISAGDMDMNKRRDTIPEHFNSVEEADPFLGLPLWCRSPG